MRYLYPNNQLSRKYLVPQARSIRCISLVFFLVFLGLKYKKKYKDLFTDGTNAKNPCISATYIKNTAILGFQYLSVYFFYSKRTMEENHDIAASARVDLANSSIDTLIRFNSCYLNTLHILLFCIKQSSRRALVDEKFYVLASSCFFCEINA